MQPRPFLVTSLLAGLVPLISGKPIPFDITITVNDNIFTMTAPGTNPYQNGPVYCNGTAYNVTLLDTYVCGDYRLGPVRLPTHAPPLASLVESYDRFAGLTPGAFLEEWWDPTGNTWYWPEQSGFSLDLTNNTISGNVTLAQGTYVDRFGLPWGKFLAPVSTPYVYRALPPNSLDTPQGNPKIPYNYHIYQVLKPFVVLGGPIAPWFGQIGQGVQYQTYVTVQALLDGGFLEEIMSGDAHYSDD